MLLLRAVALLVLLPLARGNGGRPAPPPERAARVERAVRKISFENSLIRAEGVGVFVAPGELLTCRHVVLGSARPRVHAPDGRVVEVRAVLAESEALDAVLLEVPFDPERDAHLPLGRTPHARLRRPRLRAWIPVRFSDDPESGERFEGHWWRGPLLRRVPIPGGGELLGVSARIEPGHSGTPLLDDEAARVVALGGFRRPVLTDTAEHAPAVRLLGVSAESLRNRLERFPAPVPFGRWSVEAVQTPSGLVEMAHGPAEMVQEDLGERLLLRALEMEPGHVEALVSRLEPRYVRSIAADDTSEEELRPLLRAILETKRTARPRYAFDPILLEQLDYWEARVRMRLADDPGARRALLSYTARARFDPDGFVLLWAVARRLGDETLARRARERFTLLTQP